MSTALRVGFVVSGLLHVAVVAAFSRAAEPTAAPPDPSRPITLQLAMFQPAEPPPAPVEAPREVAPEPEPEPVQQEPEPKPEPLVAELPEPPRDEPPPPPPEPAPRPVTRPKPPAKPVARQVQAAPPPVPQVQVPAPAPRLVASAEVAREAVPAPDPAERQHYLAALAATIDRSKFYPRTSRRRGEEGRVMVRFVIQKDGRLTDLVITESSGYSRLDEAALQTLQRVTPFKPIPATLGRDSWSISVPIAFSLRG